MKKKAYLSFGIRIVLALLFVVIAFLLSALFYESNCYHVLLIITILSFILSIGIIIQSIYGIITRSQIYKEASTLKYGFNYHLEYEIYKRIDKKRLDKLGKELVKQGITIPNRYTKWKTNILERYGLLLNNEDFFHFLKDKLRDQQKMHDSFAVILTPLEIGIMTVYLTVYLTKGGELWQAFWAAIFILVLLIIVRNSSKKEIEFCEDTIEIICPEYCGIEKRERNDIGI